MLTSSEQGQINVSFELLASSVQRMLAADLSMSSKVCIFKVPKILKRHNPQAYEPNAFSIGPFRHGQENLKPTEKIKLKYLQGLLRRSGHSEEEALSQLIAAVRAIQNDARECYAGPISCCMEDFVQILLLDGCFIIELFRKDAEQVKKDQDDPIFSMSCLLEFLKHDLILLENQIPWLVLERLFDLFDLNREPGDKSLIELVLDFYGNLFSSHKPNIKPTLFANHEIKHILDLLRLSLVLPVDQLQKHSGWQPFPTAKKAKDCGIKFKYVVADSVLDVRFSHGVLEIPPLLVQETTETIFRNLISFEQCLPNCPPVITSYAILMDSLIDTTADVEILCDNDVLDNWLNPDDATRFFNKLYNDAYVKTFYYHDLCQEVNTYSRRWWPKWRSFYAQNYFNTPWAIVSQVVAVVFLILGFVQTYYAIATYLHETK